jgi:hypothetical protein
VLLLPVTGAPSALAYRITLPAHDRTKGRQMPTYATPPRIIVEQQPDGSIVAEFYINGARSRQTLTLGFEAFEIKAALADQARANAAAAAREAERAQAQERERHNRVWNYVASSHGIGFANRTVNGTSSLKRNARVDAAPTADVVKPDASVFL